jgi:hypothetical protein
MKISRKFTIALTRVTRLRIQLRKAEAVAVAAATGETAAMLRQAGVEPHSPASLPALRSKPRRKTASAETRRKMRLAAKKRWAAVRAQAKDKAVKSVKTS